MRSKRSTARCWRWSGSGADSRRGPGQRRHFDEEKNSGDDSRHIDDSDSWRESLDIAAGLALRLLEWRITSNRKEDAMAKKAKKKKAAKKKKK
jgi:hypothetical protein